MEMIFTEKDYLNYRYFQKRAYYLACISQTIQNNSACGALLNFGMQDGNPLSPVLLVQQAPGTFIPSCPMLQLVSLT